jgi:hypothetical protein
MKKKQIFLLSILCLLLTACGSSYTDNAIILKAESLLNEHPDSAYQLLSGINKPEQLSKSDYAAWCLHYTHARYKLYLDIKSDSLINIAVNYYANSHLKKYCGTSYYVLGCVSDLLQQENKAMLAYKNAALALDGTKEYNTIGLVSINMAYIYELNKNYHQAKVCIKKSLVFFKLSGNKKCLASAYLELSNMCLELEYPFDSTLLYSNKALKLAKEANDNTLYYIIMSRQGELLNRKKPRQAICYLLNGFIHCSELKIRNASFLAYIYSTINMPDSASYYLKIANKEKGNNELEQLKNLTGAAVFESRNDFRQAYHLIENAYLNQDTVFRKNLQSQSYKIDKQFDLSEKEKESAELKIANRTKIIFIGMLIILVLIILYLFQRRDSKNKEKQAEFEIKQQKLEFELREKGLENSKKHELLLSKLQQRIEMTLRFNRIQQGVLNPKKHEEFVETMINQVILVKSEWQYYIDETNSLFNNKITDLKEKYTELTPSDIIAIVLISLGMDISDSCVLLNSSKETMYGRRKRIKKHLGLGNEIDLEEWIKQMIS